MTRIDFEGDLHRVAGDHLYVGGPGKLYQITGATLACTDLPYSDAYPLAVDTEGFFILGRPSGDQIVRRYTPEGKLDATYGFTLNEIRSVAVSGRDLIVAFQKGLIQRIDERTVPRIEYSRRAGIISHHIDALGDRIAVAGEKGTLLDSEGTVLGSLPSSKKIRLRERGFWVLNDSLQGEDRTLLPADLGLESIRDVVCSGGAEWALGEALVKLP